MNVMPINMGQSRLPVNVETDFHRFSSHHRAAWARSTWRP
jgi:hypothetical protein